MSNLIRKDSPSNIVFGWVPKFTSKFTDHLLEVNNKILLLII